MRPAVDQTVMEISGDFNILRVDIHTDFGMKLQNSFGFSFTPEFILFDSTGHEIWRSHILPSEAELALATGEAINTE